MKKTVLLCSLVAIVAFVAGLKVNQITSNRVINAYDAYNRDCEALLDSIASWDDSFMDTTGETDVYCDYCDSRAKLDSILWNK